MSRLLGIQSFIACMGFALNCIELHWVAWTSMDFTLKCMDFALPCTLLGLEPSIGRLYATWTAIGSSRQWPRRNGTALWLSSTLRLFSFGYAKRIYQKNIP